MLGFLAFLPPIHYFRELAGLPETENLLYAWLVPVWIFIFGLAYLRLAFSSSTERLFVGVSAAGKATFAFLLIILALNEEVAWRAAFFGLIDLVLAGVFVVGLCKR
jgi:hypothetical protein